MLTESKERRKKQFFAKDIKTTPNEGRSKSQTKFKFENDVSYINNTENSNFNQFKFTKNNEINTSVISSKNQLYNNDNKISISCNDFDSLTKKLRSLEIQRNFNEKNLNDLIKTKFKNKINKTKLNYTKIENNNKNINCNPKNKMIRSYSCNFSYNSPKSNLYVKRPDKSKEKQIRKEINSILTSLEFNKKLSKKPLIIKRNKSFSKLFCVGYEKSLKDSNNFNNNENSKKENKQELMKMKILSKCKLIDIKDNKKNSYFDFNYNRKYINIIQNDGIKDKNGITKKTNCKKINDLIDTINFINS